MATAAHGPVVDLNSAWRPTTVTCPKCKEEVTTEVKYVCGIFNLICCLYGWQWCCAPIWFRWYRDVTHICPKCQTELGVIKKIPF